MSPKSPRMHCVSRVTASFSITDQTQIHFIQVNVQYEQRTLKSGDPNDQIIAWSKNIKHLQI